MLVASDGHVMLFAATGKFSTARNAELTVAASAPGKPN